MIFSYDKIEYIIYCTIAILGFFLLARQRFSILYLALNAIYFGLRFPIGSFSAISGLQLSALSTLPAILIFPKIARKIKSYPVLWIVFSLLTIFEMVLIIITGTGFFPTPSFSFCIWALLWGYYGITRGFILFSIPVLYSLFHHGTTSKLMILTIVICGILSRIKSSFVKSVLVLSSLFISAVSVFFTNGDVLLGGTERLTMWKEAMGYFFHGGNASMHRYLLGMGAGSYQLLGGAIHGFEGGFFMHLHNDILQLFFEFGFIGIAIVSLYIVRSMVDHYKEGDYARIGLTLCVVIFSTFYMPFHFTYSSIVCLLILI